MSTTFSFMSSDADAPRLSGTVGDFTNLLDKILVDGYNSKTVTITRTGTTATINCTSHGFRDGQILAVSGANESDYNITARCTYVDANNVTIQVANSPATPATGTITCKVAPAGWSIAYTGTNLRSYRQPAGTSQLYLGVDDTGTTNARYRGFETMTAAGVAVGSGTNPFPTDAQVSGGGYYYKSNSASTTARDWIAIVNNGLILLFGGGGASDYSGQMVFGDAIPNDAADVWPTICYCAESSNKSNPVHLTASPIFPYTTSNLAGCFIVRNKAGAAGCVRAMNYSEAIQNSGATSYPPGSYGWMTYPSPVYGGLLMSPWEIVASADYLHGPRFLLPGLWSPWHSATNFGQKDTFTGAAGTPLADKKFIIIKAYNSDYGTLGAYILELTDF
ncbi:MAG TPA: hypothetical protein PLL30_17085 [Candidatus Krumholzibacteria bacterium]|nr:hypothetical protein [Candidatus Krumholzibacteria bacterium]HPD73490.1 hypothetical protein [Candidatus Krumholzibacteria bacterium]HRY42213.1 hypothetical protein [Candidatus Krumholzibacteria bacterium]